MCVCVCGLQSVLPGIATYLLAFFGLLHCWMNLFAELTRFADRTFYADWWNTTSFSSYYRKVSNTAGWRRGRGSVAPDRRLAAISLWTYLTTSDIRILSRLILICSICWLFVVLFSGT